jgi:D-alanyl-D-alanine carboxypeptidase (penicillin-binding protein 5/6)
VLRLLRVALFMPLFVLFFPLQVLGQEPSMDPAPKARAAVLMDVATGRVLYSKNPDTPQPIASMTKLMTLYVALQAVARGKVHLTDQVPVSEAAYRTGGSQIWLEPGESLPLQQLLTAIAVGSANDACVAVAEHVAGSVPAFVAEMNRTAMRLGMRHTHFTNPHGLDEAGHASSARDMAILARAAVRVPGLLALTAVREDRSIRDGKGGKLWLVNHNRLLGRYQGLDGLKTGFTNGAGYCLAATALRDGMRLVAVVMGEPTSKTRFQEAGSLLDYGFTGWRSVLVVPADKVFGPVPVLHGVVPAVRAHVPGGLAVLLPRREEARLTTRVHLRPNVSAPVAKGTVLGRLTVLEGGRPIAEARLVSVTAVERMTFRSLFLRLLRGVLHLGVSGA